MSSPIHSFLFSPPSSPRLLPAVDGAAAADPNRHFTSLKSLLPPDMLSRSASESELKPRSPRTPQQSTFTLDGAYPSAYPSRHMMPTDATPKASAHPVIAVSTATMATPKAATDARGHARTDSLPAPAALAKASPIPHSLPKPVIRLLLLVSLILSSIALLVFVPAARLPSLRAAAISRRLALDPSGRAVLDVAHNVDSFAAAQDRDYVPPQVRSRRITRRMLDAATEVQLDDRASVSAAEADEAAVAATDAAAAVAPALALMRSRVRPLPPTHELLALQSFVLGSSFNVLPPTTDGSVPLDANAVGVPASHRHHAPGAEQAWLADIAREHADDVTVWYGADGSKALPAQVLDVLAALSDRTPTLVPCHSRADLHVLRAVFGRLSYDLSLAPVLFIGNEAIMADAETLDELRSTGELQAMLRRAGWLKDASKPRREIKPLKYAKLKRRTAEEDEWAM